MPKTITEEVDGEVLTMVEPYFIVTLKNEGGTWYMRGTTFSFAEDRATEFQNIDEAAAAMARARKFNPARTMNACVVVPRGGDFVR